MLYFEFKINYKQMNKQKQNHKYEEQMWLTVVGGQMGSGKYVIKSQNYYVQNK